MTQSSAPKDQQASGVLRGEDHDRGLQEVDAVLTAIERPVHSVLRVSARVSNAQANPEWTLPNVAFRLHLDGGELSRIYTVREFDAASSTMVFDVVLHAHESPMMRWAASAKVGDRIHFTGPRQHFPIPAGRKVALFLDETGIPALYALLQQWPQGVHATGWVATDDAAAFAELPKVFGVKLHRIGQHDSLAPHARALAEPKDYVVWGAGERDDMRAVRQYFRDTVGLGKDAVAIAGYWKKGYTNTQIDQRRREDYEKLLAGGGTLADFDDLAVEMVSTPAQ